MPTKSATTTPTGILFGNAGEVYCYPSPARGQEVWFYYRAEGLISLEISVYNVAGEPAGKVKGLAGADHTIRLMLDLGQMAPGVYLYQGKLEKSGGIVSTTALKKFVVVKGKP
ncbi:MAG: T9SS type A sorting domain-containing protein [Candidatus Firestonebacteria bacterium]|nr:T9SS type A sorting domain-containing protein [Candidatus Firestonebacteria bacterium]